MGFDILITRAGFGGMTKCPWFLTVKYLGWQVVALLKLTPLNWPTKSRLKKGGLSGQKGKCLWCAS